MRPKLGFKPTMPESAAGIRIEPPASDPSAIGTQPVATATAEPPDEPPAVWLGFQGLPVGPQRGLSVKLEWANSGVVVFPIMMPPAFFRRSTRGGSKSGTQCSKTLDPSVVRLPAVGVKSLIANGTPCNGPTCFPERTSRSASCALSNASSA